MSPLPSALNAIRLPVNLHGQRVLELAQHVPDVFRKGQQAVKKFGEWLVQQTP